VARRRRMSWWRQPRKTARGLDPSITRGVCRQPYGNRAPRCARWCHRVPSCYSTRPTGLQPPETLIATG